MQLKSLVFHSKSFMISHIVLQLQYLLFPEHLCMCTASVLDKSRKVEDGRQSMITEQYITITK